MFCERCGTQIGESDLFCFQCGYQTNPTPANVSVAGNDILAKKKKIIFIIAVAIVFAAIIYAIMGGESYQKTVDNYFKAHETRDPDLLISSVFTESWIRYADDNLGEAHSRVDKMIRNNIQEWGCGTNVRISHKITDKKQLNKEQLLELHAELYDNFYCYIYGDADYEITDAYILEVTYTVRGENGVGTYDFPEGLLVVKENGKWRIPRGYIECSFYSGRY